MLPTYGPFDLWPHLLTVEYDYGGDPWALVCRQCVGAAIDEMPYLIAYVLLDGAQPSHGDDFEYATPEGMVAVAAEHLEDLSEYFPRFDRDHLATCASLAALANDPFPGIAALLEGRSDCLVRTESVEESQEP